jgi:iron complex transport system substrate-binding protein
MYRELYEGKGREMCLDIIEMVKRYMDEHYHEEVSIQALANAVHISTSQLSRLFKAREKKSTKEYLTDKRLNVSKIYLAGSNATIREIALSCGFSDEFCFAKAFKHHNKITPGDFRKITTIQLRDFTIDNPSLLPYNKEKQVSNSKLEKGEENMILKNIRNKALRSTAIFSMLLLCACQSNAVGTANEVATESLKEENTDSSSVANKKESRVIHMEYGDVEVPANPQRVVVTFFQGDLLALGIKPIGTSFNDDAVFEEALSDVAIIDAFGLNPEEIMALDPDLIIWNNPTAYEDLSKIAPTIAMNFYNGLTYEERLTFFGEIFGLEEKAAQLIEEFEEKVTTAKEKLKQNALLDKNVILLENQQQGVLRAFGDNYGRGGEIIYQHLGLPAQERIQKEVIDKEDVSYIDIGYEMLNQYVGDYIFSNEAIDALADTPIWTSLPAVKEGRLIKASAGMFWFSDITSMNAQLDFIVDSLLETLK